MFCAKDDGEDDERYQNKKRKRRRRRKKRRKEEEEEEEEKESRSTLPAVPASLSGYPVRAADKHIDFFQHFETIILCVKSVVFCH